MDDAIEEALLGVVGPGAVAASMAAAEQAADRRDQVREALGRDLEAARYAADRAFRQYDAADPANRLIAGGFRGTLKSALARVADVESKIVAHEAASPAPTIDPAALALLGANLKMVWSTPTTNARLKKRIVRTLIHEVVADIDDDASEIVIVVHWTGGVHSEIRLPKRRRGQRNSTSAVVGAAVAQLALIASDDLIAGLLNRNGLKTGHGNRPEPANASPRCARVVENPGVQGHREWHRALAQSLRRRTPIEGRAQDPAVGGGGRRDRGEPPLAGWPLDICSSHTGNRRGRMNSQMRTPQRQTPRGTRARSAKPLPLNDIDRWVFRCAVVEVQISIKRGAHFEDAAVGVQIHLPRISRCAIAVQRTHVAPGAFAVHADRYLIPEQHAGEGLAGELTALIRVEYFRLAIFGEGFLQRLDTKSGIR